MQPTDKTAIDWANVIDVMFHAGHFAHVSGTFVDGCDGGLVCPRRHGSCSGHRVSSVSGCGCVGITAKVFAVLLSKFIPLSSAVVESPRLLLLWIGGVTGSALRVDFVSAGRVVSTLLGDVLFSLGMV